MKEILEAILDPGSQPADFAVLPLPEAYRAVTLHRDEEHMFDGVPDRDRDPRTSLHVEEVPVPELGLGEALVAVMASSVNYNTVWSSIFSPVPTFAFHQQRYGQQVDVQAAWRAWRGSADGCKHGSRQAASGAAVARWGGRM